METTMTKPSDFSVESHGVENCQYFQGAGVALTEWNICYTGCGQTEHEAFQDALEQIGMDEWDTSEIEAEYDKDMDRETTVIDALKIESDEEAEECECYYYVTVYLK